MPPVPRSDVEQVKSLENVHGVEYDEPLLMFSLRGQIDISIQVPDKYPNGKAQFFAESQSGDVGPGSLKDLVLAVIAILDGRNANSSQSFQDEEEECMMKQTSSDMMREGTMDARQDSMQYFDDSSAFEHDLAGLTAYGDAVTQVGMSKSMSHLQAKWKLYLTNLISRSVARAWGLDVDLPVDVTVRSSVYYTDAPEHPIVSITQNGSKIPVGQQLGRILDSYLKAHWPNRFPLQGLPRHFLMPKEET